MQTRTIGSEDAAAAALVVRMVRDRPGDLIDPFPPVDEMEMLVDMGARGKGDAKPRVALEGTEIVGIGAIDYSESMRRAVLVGPVVHPAYRRKGHGRRLLEELVEQARETNQKTLRAAAGSTNAAATALLKELGFRQRDRHTCLRLARPPRMPDMTLDGIRVERVEAEQDELYHDFTRKLVPRLAKQARALLKSSEYVALLAFKGKKPIGCAEIDMRFGEAGSVENIEAASSWLRKGLGNVLLSEAIKVAFANEQIRHLDFLMAGTDRATVDQMREAGCEVRHELIGYELKL